MKTIIVWKVNNGDTVYYESNPKMIVELLNEMQPSDSDYFKITCHYMTEQDYSDLPEFIGF